MKLYKVTWYAGFSEGKRSIFVRAMKYKRGFELFDQWMRSKGHTPTEAEIERISMTTTGLDGGLEGIVRDSECQENG